MQFAKVIATKSTVLPTEKGTLQDIVFKPLPHRDEDAVVLRGCIEEEPVQLTLHELRAIVQQLIQRVLAEGFRQGDTVMLLSTTATNELYTALWFVAFTCLAIKVILPIFPEVSEFENWATSQSVKAVFMPLAEIRHLKDYERLKTTTNTIERLCRKIGVKVYDQANEFGLEGLIFQVRQGAIRFSNEGMMLPGIDPDQEAVVFSTSGTTGITKLVTYTHDAFYKNCLHWQEAGLYKQELCGSACFTPLFTHTIGVRSLVNALWTGHPLCFITVDWFYRKPEVVRYFLLKMKPAHIVGGPAMFNTVVELYRQFPELKQELKPFLKCLISIGAPYNLQTASAIKNITGLELYNAFGTTETQLVSISLGVNGSNTTLGTPLPGVTFGLKETCDKQFYELFVAAPYQSVNANKKQEENFLPTGDLVTYHAATDTLVYAQRSSTDFLKDDFGIKIPLPLLEKYYQEAYDYADHIEWFPLNHQPGLAALIFLKASAKDISAKQLAALFKNRNEQLQALLEPLEFTHRHIARFAVTTEEMPRSRKGTFSKGAMAAQHVQLIADLKNPFVRHDDIEVIEGMERDRCYRFMDPHLAELLQALKMDVTYVRAKGDFLYYRKEGIVKKVLDLAGGFGANLLGHNHPILQQVITEFIRKNKIALNNQGSSYYYPSLLAQKLTACFAQATGKFFKVQLANSGAEAVEVALHHAYDEWLHNIEKFRDQQLQLYGAIATVDVATMWERNMEAVQKAIPAVFVLKNGFHGYTSGARSLLEQKERRTRCSGLLKPEPIYLCDLQSNWKAFIDDNITRSTVTLRTVEREDAVYVVKERKQSRLIAAIFEPVMGEGGIHVVNTEVADYLAEQQFPLIADEIQCGLGRTGTLPAYPHADYYLLGKSLGGGFEKIAAVLIDDNRFKPAFSKHYVSTFANGERAALAGVTTIDLVQKQQLAQQASKRGIYFLQQLQRIADAYPGIIASVQGKGLMIGVHFNSKMGDENNLLRLLYEHELIGYLFSAWFFHRHDIRILPSLSAPACLRIEPSFFITKKAIHHFCMALEELCQICLRKELAKLLSFLMNDDPYDDVKPITWKGRFPNALESCAPGAIKVGFISNFTNPTSELKVIEPALQNASETGLRILFNRLEVLLEGKPVKIIAKNLLQGKVHFTFYLIPFDTAFLENVNRWGKKRFYITKIQQAVNKLVEEGVTLISLGAYASIITNNGLSLAAKNGAKIITGNTLTISSCLYHLDQHLDGIPQRSVTIAIVGASGNIGSGIVKCLTDKKYNSCSLILVGTNQRRLQKLQEESNAVWQHSICTTNLFALKNADILICCTNTNDPLLFPHHLSAEKPVFVIDIAVPKALSDEAAKLPNVSVCKNASSVRLLQDPDLLISSHTDKGKIFCCAAEVILDALHGTDYSLKGHVDPEAVMTFYRLAEKEGFFQ
jgi:acetylornithine/succinyldiaminopimelate/putrescine aminotransferase/predicted amino acid dehydrogenase/long-subunit acyl-CoA synthetase (AMP-forming)